MPNSTAEERLRARVGLLRDQYLEAVSTAQRASVEFADKSLPAPDGSLAYRKALVAEGDARLAYTQALADFAQVQPDIVAMKTALRVLHAVTDNHTPQPADVEKLQRLAPSLANSPLDELA